MRFRSLTLAAALACALPACSGAGDLTPTAAPTLTTTPPQPFATALECAPGAPTTPAWPSEIPAIVPRPQSARIVHVNRGKNLTQVRFETTMSMRDSVLFIVREFRDAGFTLGRGDTEATETDAPFARGDALRGLVQVYLLGDCRTMWLLSVVRNVNAPYNLTYSPPPSSTPLPFG